MEQTTAGPLAEIRSRVERVVGGIMRPSMEATPLPDEVALVDAVMSAVGHLPATLRRKDRLLRRLEEQRDEQRARANSAEEDLRQVRAALTAALPPVGFVKRRLATHPFGGEQNYLELAEAVWRAIGGWPDAESEV